jgi:hypothetical protein
VSHRPKIGSQAYAIRLYPGADEDMLAAYEEIHGVAIPDLYRSVLRHLNGGHIFQMSLLGVPPLMAKRPPQIDRSTSWPLDIGTGQTDWGSEYEPDRADFMIGFGPSTDGEHLGYFLWPNGGVEALRKGGAPQASWKGIGEFLTEELTRAEDLYSTYEKGMAEILSRAGTERPWWRRLWPSQ